MEEVLKNRTKKLGIDVINLILKYQQIPVIKVISNQIIRSSTSVGANYRAVCRAKSNADFINKLRIVEEEADETLFWFEILEETQIIKSDELQSLKRETNEILSIVVASIKTSLNRINKSK
jgi:four helix bundle protein